MRYHEYRAYSMHVEDSQSVWAAVESRWTVAASVHEYKAAMLYCWHNDIVMVMIVEVVW